MEGDKGSRFAELATELMGAHAVTRLLDEIWASASPEVKRDLADKVVTTLGEQALRTINDSYSSRDIVSKIVREALAGTDLDARFPQIREAFWKSFELQWPVIVERAAREKLDEALRTVKSQIR